MSRNTKDNILYNALELFNTKGESEVTLRDIALACEMSLGNLAYHYKNKSFIISALFRNMLEERIELIQGSFLLQSTVGKGTFIEILVSKIGFFIKPSFIRITLPFKYCKT